MLDARAQRYRDITQARATPQMAAQSPQPEGTGGCRDTVSEAKGISD